MATEWPRVRHRIEEIRTAIGEVQAGQVGEIPIPRGAGRVTTDTSEQGLERLICIALTGDPCEPPKADSVWDARGSYGGVGWSAGSWLDYDREHCFDLAQLIAFIQATQPEAAESLGLSEDGPTRRRFLARL